MEQAAGACRRLCSSRFSEMFSVVLRAYDGMQTEEVFPDPISTKQLAPPSATHRVPSKFSI